MRYYENKIRRLGYNLIAGVDEAGRGPLAGPVVAGAVILDKNIKGINDSKKLSPNRRNQLFQQIMSSSVVGVGIISEGIIDERDIRDATIRAMELAILRLKISPDYLLIDGLVSPLVPYPALNIIKGDQKSISVAAASIVAKVIRDRIMLAYDKLYPCYGFSQHKGYATEGHLDSLRKYGPSPFHRYTFGPVRKLINHRLNRELSNA